MFLEAPIWDGWTMHDLIKQFLKHSVVGSVAFLVDLSRRKEFVVFMVLSLIGLMLNSLCMWVGQEILRSQGINWVEGVYYMVVKILATAIVTFYNFFSRRYWLDASRN